MRGDAPVYLAQKLGYFDEQGIEVALLEPNDPGGMCLQLCQFWNAISSPIDVTEIIGSGKVDIGFKAMIHTLAAIIEDSIDAGVRLENVQMVELEEWLVGQGRRRSDVQMLRIDELDELGELGCCCCCCCVCSILYIANDGFIAANKIKRFGSSAEAHGSIAERSR